MCDSLPPAYDFIQEIEPNRYLCRHKLSHCLVVASPLARSPKAFSTITMMRLLNHPFLVKLFDIVETDTEWIVVNEFPERDSIYNYISMKGSLSEDKARKLILEIILALAYVHTEKRAYYGSFDACQVFLDRYKNARLTNSIGHKNTSLYAKAPEVLLDQPYSPLADIWSAGILLFYMTAGYLPFDDNNDGRLTDLILKMDPSYPTTFSPQLKDLLEKMLTKDPLRRITIDGIKQHPFFTQEINYQMLMNLRYKSESIDPCVQREMEDLGVDTSNLYEEVDENVPTPSYTLYQILQRKRLVEEMNDLKDSLFSPKVFAFGSLPSIRRMSVQIHQLDPEIFSERKYKTSSSILPVLISNCRAGIVAKPRKNANQVVYDRMRMRINSKNQFDIPSPTSIAVTRINNVI